MSSFRVPVAPATGARLERGIRREPARWRVPVMLLALVVVIDVVSLAITPALAFDPNAWVPWAREIVHLNLDTRGGPDWKPLGVVLDLPAGIFFRSGMVNLYVWLFIARGGALLGILAVSLIAYRMEGWGAAVLAFVFTAVSEWWYFNGVLGNIEPLMVASIAGAVLAYDAGWRRTSAVLLAAAALVRPEVWPLFLLWGAWQVYEDRGRLPWAIVLCVAVAVLWELPVIMHSGSTALSAANGDPNPVDAINSKIPFYSTFKYSLVTLGTPTVGILGVVAALMVLRQSWDGWRDGRLRGLIAAQDQFSVLTVFALGEILVVAVMAQDGFDGSPNYEMPGVGILVIVGAVALMRLLRGRPVWLTAAVMIAAGGTALAFSWHTFKPDELSIKGHGHIINALHTQLQAAHCPVFAWTFDAQRSEVADLAGQSIPESAHPGWFQALHAPQLVYCSRPRPASG